MPFSTAPPRWLALGAALGLLSLLLLTPALPAASGGDAFGYTWADLNEPGGPTLVTYDWINGRVSPDGSFTPAGADWTTTVTMPQPFPFYGQRFTQFVISDNGFLSFDPNTMVEGTNKPIPLNQTPDTVIAPLWDEWNTTRVQWGRITGNTGYKVRWEGTIRAGGNDNTTVWAEAILFYDGRIRFQFWAGSDNGSTTMGIESPGAVYGNELLYNGAGPANPDPLSGYVAEFTPPVVPDCSNPEPIVCGSNPSSTAAAEPVPAASFYSCSADDLLAWEKVFTFTVSETSSVTATLADLGGRDLRLFQLDGCNANSCLSGDSTSLDLGLLTPGNTYYLVVDGATAADNGTFTVNLDCQAVSTQVQCDETVPGDTSGRPANLDGYACAPGGADYSGAEQIFDINLPAGGNLYASVLNNPDLDVFLFPAGSLDPADCLTMGDVTAAGFGLAAGDYVIVVDGPSGLEGTFDLEVACGTQLDCATPQPTVLTCGSQINDVIAAGDGSAFAYDCDDGSWRGGEHVYQLDITNPTGVIVNFTSPDGLGVFLLDGCDEGNCLGGNDGAACSNSLAAGTYTMVVDSPDSSGGAYDLQIQCIPPNQFSRWDACEEPFGQTQPGDTVRQNWGFNDNWYCVDCPTHRNNNGSGYNGCNFAMYAVVDCGTEMHLPLRDVEAGRLRIYDVLNERYVTLFGDTPTWSSTGTELEWIDSGCTDGDPCTAGADPRFNNVVNDIRFFNDDDPGTAPVCGVFRMEFYDWGGFEWYLFANCTGDDSARFNIYDNVCDALDAYDPKPELSILNPTDDGACPNPTLDFEMTNTGCTPAEDFVVTIMEELEDGTLIPATIEGQPDNTLEISSVGPGETISLTPRINLSSSTSPAVIITADGTDVVFECSEADAVGGATACRPQEGRHEFRFPVCDSCVSLPVATANPARVCSGEATTLSAAGSTVPTCANGVPLEYNWTATNTQPGVNDPNWTTSQTLDMPRVDQDTTWYLWVRCQNDTACINVDGIPVTVSTHQPPVPRPAAAADIDICERGIEVTWEPAQFFHDPANGPGTYNVYRAVSTGNLVADCDTARISPDMSWTALQTNTLVDNTTQPNETYVYVVEAEDAEPNNPCPAGPAGGAVADVCIAAPVWDEVDRTPPQNDVGNTLRVGKGNPFPITFDWQDPRQPADMARERFRVNRSEIAYGPYSVVGDLIDSLTFDDPDAPAILHFYEVRTMDTCGNVAADAFPPDRDPPPSCANLNLTCGATLEASSEDCASQLDSHDCFARDATGPDRLHNLRLDADYSDVTIQVSSSTADLDLYVYDLALSSCVNWGDTEVNLFNTSAGERYWVIVDGAAGELGDYTLEVTCTP